MSHRTSRRSIFGRVSQNAIIVAVLLAWLSLFIGGGPWTWAGGATAHAQSGDSGVGLQGSGETGAVAVNCRACHRQPAWSGIEGARVDVALCLDCHADSEVQESAQQPAERTALYVDPERHRTTIHGEIACTACHTDLPRNPHRAEREVACSDCHDTLLTHVNMGAPHASTECAACHLEALPVNRDGAGGRVVLARLSSDGIPLDRTDHGIVKEAGCDKCHTRGNEVGAPSVTLPARSILCMACHDASPTVSVAWLDATPVRTDYGSLAGLLVFGVGIVLTASLYLRGQVPGHPGLTPMEKLSYLASGSVRFLFSRRIFCFVWRVITDGILQRRVLRQSVGRWVMHELIFLPFLGRFLLGFATWLGEAFWPAAAWTKTLANKDTPGVAFAYDFLATLVLMGVLFALVRRFVLRDRRLLSFAQDKVAISLLGALFLLGIVAEGTRLLSAGTPREVAVYSFLGYGLSAVLRPLHVAWTSVYPALWYAHALFAAAFIAYLPFSKFMHMWAGPLIVGLDSAGRGSPRTPQVPSSGEGVGVSPSGQKERH